MTNELNSPIDSIQADCMTQRQVVLGWVQILRENIQEWRPRPMPADFQPTQLIHGVVYTAPTLESYFLPKTKVIRMVPR